MLVTGFSQNTVRAFDSDLRIFSRFIGPRAEIGSISHSRLDQFLHHLRHERPAPCKPKSLARRITVLKVFFSWLVQMSAIPSDPAKTLIHQPVTTPLPRVLSEAELASLRQTTNALRNDPDSPDARPHLLITLVLDTAVKKAECMRVTLPDLDVRDPASATLFVRYGDARGRHKERRLRLSADFVLTLPIYVSQYRPAERLFECTGRNLEYVLHDAAKRSGIPRGVLTFEGLRWTSALRSYQEGMDPDDLRRRLGLSEVTWAETAHKLQRLSEPPL